MAHHIYHTRGIILGSVSTGESNRFYKIFTEELGLVGASAQSVREGKSKLKYVLQDFSFITLDLVRGKEVWRITSAGEWRGLAGVKGDVGRTKHLARFCALISRLVHGEGRETELFSDLVSFVDFLEANTVPTELVPALEALSAFRILARLGYVDTAEYEVFLSAFAWTKEILEEFEKVRLDSIPKINEAIQASHL